MGILGLRSKRPDGVILGEGGKGKGAAHALQLGHARLRLSCICRYTSLSARPALSFTYVCRFPVPSDFAHSSRAQCAPPPSLRKSALGFNPSRSLSASPLITPPRRPQTQVRRCGSQRRGWTFLKARPLASPAPPLLIPSRRRCQPQVSD